MLRRTQSVSLKEDPPAEPVAAPRPESARRNAGQAQSAIPPNVNLEEIAAWRAELERTLAPKVDPRNMAARPRVRSRVGMPASRIALIVVALVAGSLAAYFATRDEPKPAVEATTPAAVPEVVPEPKVQILVAKQAIGIGQRLTAGTTEWVDWPEDRVRTEFITAAAAPDAIDTMAADAVARFEFFPGEPIREEKLAHADQGFLSAVLTSGMRAVSVNVTADSASGGFIVPNDRVDVVATRTNERGLVSETVLRNVRVLAINTRLGETGTTGEPTDPANPRAEIFADQAIATLELDPTQAEVIINSTGMGKLALVLRPLVDASQAGRLDQRSTNQVIRQTSPFWAK